ncbi:CO(2)-response secreted protease isoform X2 [Hevea brasiliensis]|uniref:CO(2)-response secreted protease isoform X2 n=1 Tax=Hevea brasiliensis TaxID=3981 RepID=UPI0025F05562|nr:CO(2)-response secreted protease isoform X2 [Hevea brasiliensis]
MASFLLLLLFSFMSCPIFSSSAPLQTTKPYIVYMGSSWNDQKTEVGARIAESAHLHLLSSIIPSQKSERISLIHSYHHAFNGFSAMLTEDEASLLSGIWPESPSFNDDHMGQIPSRWKGVCMDGSDFKKSNCNRKLIGARYYNFPGSPRDISGHGTHTASTAAGLAVANASFYGLARGTARGGAPSARIASYNICSERAGCTADAMLKAIDDAIEDGVDVISISMGSDIQLGFLQDPVAIGAFHAEQMGVMVICSAGNDGPDAYTVSHTAPWILTVAASSIDRDFQSRVMLGNGRTIEGSAINFSNLTRSKMYPLALGENVASNNTLVSDARNCVPGSLDSKKASGKIIVCVTSNKTIWKEDRAYAAESVKARGLILVGENVEGYLYKAGSFPFTEVEKHAGYKIFNYIKSSKKPVATILPSVDVLGIRPSPVVASFSSRGPGNLTENILKPDIMAPGVHILAAIPPLSDEPGLPIGKKPSKFGIKSGTSMACPHVSGAAAFIKSVHPNWSTSMIRSALMTTATISNNMEKPLTNTSGYPASPHEAGVGEISPARALDPGLVFETTEEDYLNFLCYYGYSETKVKKMTKTKFKCPKGSSKELITSSINHPSISVGKLDQKHPAQIIRRKMTNVGSTNASYYSRVYASRGLTVNVSPKKISFNESKRKAWFRVLFDGRKAPKGYHFGYVMWSDGHHRARIVFAVNVH